MEDILSVFSSITRTSLVDILLVAFIFFVLLKLIQGTQAVQLLRGIITLAVAMMAITSLLPQLTALRWLLQVSYLGVWVAIPVVFQPELRRALERVGRTGAFFNRPLREAALEQLLEAVITACFHMSERRIGALIVMERETGLQDVIETGVSVDASVSRELLETIFYPGAPLHDGAVIIRGERIVAAACVLPLSTAPNIVSSDDLGTRHRAALGISESSDAIGVVVSEETGIISVTHQGRIIRRLSDERLRKVLQTFYKSQFQESVGWMWGDS